MSILIECPHCRGRCKIKEEWAGGKVKCPGCGKTIAVSSSQPKRFDEVGGTSVPSDLLDAVSGPALSSDPLAPAPLLPSSPLHGARRKKGGGNSVLLVVGIAAGFVVVSCAGISVAVFVALDRKLYSSQVGGPATTISATNNPDLPVWSADAALAAQLGSEVVLDRYAMRLPQGYSAFQTDAKPPPKPPGGKSQDWTWVSPPTARGTRHMISAWLFDVGPAIDPQRFYEAHLPEYLAGIRKRAQVHRTEHGKLAGRFTVRVESSQTAPNGAVVNSVDLFWFDGRCMINLSAGAAEADGPEYFNLMKTALLTLHAPQ